MWPFWGSAAADQVSRCRLRRWRRGSRARAREKGLRGWSSRASGAAEPRRAQGPVAPGRQLDVSSRGAASPVAGGGHPGGSGGEVARVRGVDRREQRQLYDERRDTEIPKHALQLLVIK